MTEKREHNTRQELHDVAALAQIVDDLKQTVEHTSLTTTAYWTFASGGLVDGKPVDGRSHLIARQANGGTPGPTLCGIDRFAKGGPGGGRHPTSRNPFGVQAPVCPTCVDELRSRIKKAQP